MHNHRIHPSECLLVVTAYYPVDAWCYEPKGGSVTARVAEYGCEESDAVAVLGDG